MHTIHESNYAVIKLPRSGNSKAKKINEKQLSLLKLSSTTNEMDALDNFYTYHPFVDWYKTTQDKRHSQHFSKRIGFWTWCLSNLRILLHTNMLCKSLYEWLYQKWLSIHFLFLSKNERRWFEISCCKRLSFNNSETHPGHGRCVTCDVTESFLSSWVIKNFSNRFKVKSWLSRVESQEL